MSKLHIKGWNDDIKLENELSDNYDFPHDFGSDDDTFETTLEEIPNVTLQIYSSDTQKSLEKVEEDHIREILGDMSVEGCLDGYSEYTITGFYIYKMWIGGHDVQKIINSYDHKYLHILLSWEDS